MSHAIRFGIWQEQMMEHMLPLLIKWPPMSQQGECIWMWMLQARSLCPNKHHKQVQDKLFLSQIALWKAEPLCLSTESCQGDLSDLPAFTYFTVGSLKMLRCAKSLSETHGIYDASSECKLEEDVSEFCLCYIELHCRKKDFNRY